MNLALEEVLAQLLTDFLKRSLSVCASLNPNNSFTPRPSAGCANMKRALCCHQRLLACPKTWLHQEVQQPRMQKDVAQWSVINLINIMID